LKTKLFLGVIFSDEITFHVRGEVKRVVGFGVAGIPVDTWNMLGKTVEFSRVHAMKAWG
jgi:hypothetical protein